jgi:hypothetical protein
LFLRQIFAISPLGALSLPGERIDAKSEDEREERIQGRTRLNRRRGVNSKMSARKALLLRVGMDLGTGGALGPIFRDSAFEYIPIPETAPSRSRLTYASLPGRRVPSLALVLPRRLADRRPHIDPDFDAWTYGDAAPRKRRQLLHLSPGDLLLFYAGLAPVPPQRQAAPLRYRLAACQARP